MGTTMNITIIFLFGGEEWVDDPGLGDKTERAILHRGWEERRWEAQ